MQIKLSEERTKEIMNLLDRSGDGSLQLDEELVLVDTEFMVDVDPKGILKCVDGRGSDNKAFGGPKIPGGVYAIAHNRHTTSIEGLKAITKEVIDKGHVPSVHGDDSSDMMGCGKAVFISYT